MIARYWEHSCHKGVTPLHWKMCEAELSNGSKVRARLVPTGLSSECRRL